MTLTSSDVQILFVLTGQCSIEIFHCCLRLLAILLFHAYLDLYWEYSNFVLKVIFQSPEFDRHSGNSQCRRRFGPMGSMTGPLGVEPFINKSPNLVFMRTLGSAVLAWNNLLLPFGLTTTHNLPRGTADDPLLRQITSQTINEMQSWCKTWPLNSMRQLRVSKQSSLRSRGTGF